MGERPQFGALLLGGTFTHQEGYARAFAADPRCRLVAVADEVDVPAERVARNRQLAAELGLSYVAGLEEGLAQPGVDLVSVCVEHERRARVAVACARAGKHLYLDKPIACTVPGARAVAAAVREAGVRSQMFSFVHTAWARSARQAVREGAVGELRAVHAEVMFAKGHPGTAALGRPRRQEPFPRRFTFPDSKRELRATGVYALSLIRWLTRAEVRSVWAVTTNYFFAEHQRNDTEDFGLMSLELEGGLTATVTAGRIGWCSHPRGGPQRLTLVGTRGTLTLDAHQPRVEVYCDEAPWTPPAPDPSDPMGFWHSTQEATVPPKRTWVPLSAGGERSDAACFLDCIEQGREAEVTAQDGAALVEALMAAYASAARGEPVEPAAVEWPKE
jgi:myo-inositol 2-dehydrogenase / D-chiro-inositol 1-dehydrogenase